MNHAATSAARAPVDLVRHGVRRSTVTLRNLRLKGGGPPFHKFGNEVFYIPAELDGWVKQKLSKAFRSTSELPGRAA